MLFAMYNCECIVCLSLAETYRDHQPQLLAHLLTHVVDDRRSPHVLPCILLCDPQPPFPDDDAQLALVVQRLGRFGVRVDLGAVADDRGVSLREQHWNPEVRILPHRI